MRGRHHRARDAVEGSVTDWPSERLSTVIRVSWPPMSARVAWMSTILGLFLALPTGFLPTVFAYPSRGTTDAPSVRQPGLVASADQPCAVGWSDPDTSFDRSITHNIASKISLSGNVTISST